MSCPVCYAPMNVFSVTDEGRLYEDYANCPNKCYVYEYAYGNSRVFISIRGQEVRFEWSYSDEENHSTPIDIVTDAARRAQLEDYWNLVHGRDSGSTS